MAIIALVMLICFLVCLMSSQVSRWLGITGNIVVTRLLGVILAAMAVQFVLDGVKASFGLS